MRPLLQRHLLCSTPSPAALHSPLRPAGPGDPGALALPAHSSWGWGRWHRSWGLESGLGERKGLALEVGSVEQVLTPGAGWKEREGQEFLLRLSSSEPD